MSVTFDTEITLHLDCNQLSRTADGQGFIAALRNAPSLAASETYFNAAVAGEYSLDVSLPIGEIPRLGTPQTIGRGRRLYNVPAGVSICGYEHDRRGIARTRITGIVVESARPCVEVLTHRKRTIEVSESGRMAVFDPLTGMVTPRAVPDCISYMVPYVRNEPLLGTQFCREVGWWYGALVSDGWLKPSMIGYAKNDTVKRREFERITREHFDHDFSLNEYFDDGSAPDKFAQSAKIHLFSRPLRDAVLNCYCPRGPGRGALFKKIPDEILACGSRECLLGLLAGLLEGDGTLGWGCFKKRPQAVCRSNTSSWCLVQSIRRLGRLLGVRVSVTTNPPRNASNESYSLNWSLPDMVSIVPSLQFVDEDARQWQTKFRESPPTKDDIDIVPLASRLAEDLGRPLLQAGEINLYNACRQARRCYYLTRRTAKRILELTGEAVAGHPCFSGFRETVEGDDVHWDRVKELLVTGNQQVSSLVIPGLDTFMVQNSLLVPATAGLQPRAGLDGPQQRRSGRRRSA